MKYFPRLTKNRFGVALFLSAFALALLLPNTLRAQVGNGNSTGPAGQFNGNVTTAGSYDPYTGNVIRTVTDLVVAGAVGQYGLSWSRTWNSRSGSGSWQHNYSWTIDSIDAYAGQPMDRIVTFPDGRVVNYGSMVDGNGFYGSPPGVSERLKDGPSGSLCFLILPDGGRVEFSFVSSVYYDWEMQTTHYTYDFTAQAVIDPHGLRSTLTYEPDGTFKVTEPAGRWIRHSFIPAGGGWNEKVTASDGREVNYIFQTQPVAPGTVPHRLLTSVSYYDSTTAVYTYQAPNVGSADGVPLLSSCDDPMYAGPMRKISYAFATGTNPDGSEVVYGQILSEKHPSGTVVSSLTINSPTARTETRGDGPTRTFNYTDAELTSSTDFKGQSSSISYDAKGYVNATVDQRGNQTDFSNEPRTGKPIQIIHPLTPPDTVRATVQFEYGSANCPDPNNRDGNNPYYLYRATDERSHSTIYWRDANKRVIRIDYPNGAFEEFTYNSFGQVLTHKKSSGGAAGQATHTFTYDARQRLETSVPPATPSDPNPGSHPTRYFYYDSGPQTDRLWHVVDPRGNATWFEYNLRGQITKITHQDGSFRQMGYYSDGTLAWSADENHPNAATNETQRTRYIYDDYKRVTSVTNPLDQTTWSSYTRWDQPAHSHTAPFVYYAGTPGGRQVHCDSDENFRRVVQFVAPGTLDGAWTAFDYDPVGNLTSVQDPRGKITSFAYDNRNRRISATNPAPFNNEVTRWEYDTRSNVTKEIRPDQSFRWTEYDSMNRVIDTYGFANERTQYVRDLAGNVLQMIDPKPATYSFDYDALNRKISATYPPDALNAVRSEAGHYDVAGNLDEYTSVAGNKNTLEYDNRNRGWRSTWTWGGPLTVTTYDAASRVTSIETPETSVRYGYDNANRRIWEEQILAGYPTRRIETPRDADGNRSTLHVPGSYLLYFDYNHRNQLSRIRDADSNPFTTFNYDASGNMTNRVGHWGYQNGANFAYDALNRVSQVEQGDATHVFARSHYQYDVLGREVARWRDEQGSKGERFSYNAPGQLTGAIYNADNVWTGNPANWTAKRDYNYTPDLLNWASVNDNGYLAPFTNNALNQYTSINNSTPEYDIHFNLYRFDGFQYDHDAPNRLISVVGNGHSAQFTYDGLGRCVRRVVDGNTTLFTYDGWNPILEWNQGGNWQATNIYGANADEILFRHDSSGRALIYKQDKLGNVAFLLNGSNQIVEKYTYDAFGTPTILSANNTQLSTSAVGNRFMFTGREYISELGIYDYRNRFYHPGIGRFIQSDPIGFAGGDANLYRYCGGDPVNRSDPSGLRGTLDDEGNIDIPFVFLNPGGGVSPLGPQIIDGVNRLLDRSFGDSLTPNAYITTGFSRNSIIVDANVGVSRTAIGGSHGTWHLGELFPGVGLAYIAAHETLHLLGLQDLYVPSDTGIGYKPGPDKKPMAPPGIDPSNFMVGRGGTSLYDWQIKIIINNTQRTAWGRFWKSVANAMKNDSGRLGAGNSGAFYNGTIYASVSQAMGVMAWDRMYGTQGFFVPGGNHNNFDKTYKKK